jgi:uncharacterized protein with FMN-binding domain
MRRIAIAVMSTISGLVLLFSYHTSLNSGGGGSTTTTLAGSNAAATDGGATDGATADPSPTDAGPTDAGQSSTTAPADQAAKAPNTVSGTFTGDVTDTRWGPVQVRIVVKNSKITKATAIQFPDGNGHDQEINSWALPQLQKATVAVNGAGFDSLSGATVTSDGYKGSLQSALDQAHL